MKRWKNLMTLHCRQLLFFVLFLFLIFNENEQNKTLWENVQYKYVPIGLLHMYICNVSWTVRILMLTLFSVCLGNPLNITDHKRQ